MTQPSYATIVGQLEQASIPLRQLGDRGRAAVTLAGGRLVAMAFSPDAQNLLWSNPMLADSALVRTRPEALVGGLGGDRLWFSPELAYNWCGKPNWQSLENYKTPAEMDPGAYRFVNGDATSVTLQAAGKLPVHGQEHRVGFDVQRSIRTVDAPIARSDVLMSGVDYVGVEASHRLRITDDTRHGVIDLWHLLQIPVGSILVVPLKQTNFREPPLSYALPGGWTEKPDHIMWRYGGEAQAKLGLSASVLTGRSAVFRRLDSDRWCMLVRDFSVLPSAQYCDYPYGIQRTDQAFQAWDGLGFGEMEFHSPALNAELGPREYTETDRLWAFGGSAQAIKALAHHLLNVDVGYVLQA
jgi:hypothetical protein